MATRTKRGALDVVQDPSTRVVMLAAANQINIDQEAEVKRVLGLRDDWQRLALDYAEGGVGEVQNIMDFLGDAMAKLKLFAAEEGPDGSPVDTTNTAAIGSVDRLKSNDGTHADILSNLAVQLSAPGEGYLVGLAQRTVRDPATNETHVMPERWFIASIDEINQKSGGKVEVEHPDTGQKILLRGAADPTLAPGESPDFWARIWRRSKRRGFKATSSLRGVLAQCEELVIIDKAFRGIARNRVWMGKLVYIPDDISFGNADPTNDGGEDEDPFEEEWMDAITTPMQDEGTASAVAPVTLRGPRKDGGSGIEVIDVARTGSNDLQERADKLLRRIAQGLPAPPEYIFGLSEATHWGAGQIQEQAFQQYMAPLAVLMVTGLSAAYHRPSLIAAGMSPLEAERHLIWYDASALVVNTDQRDRALDAHGAMLISDEAGRRALGFDEDDAPDDAEIEQRVATKRGILAGDITEELLRRTIAPGLRVGHLTPSGVIVETPDGEQIGTPIPGATGGAPPAATASASSRPLGSRLAEIDRNLKTRIEAALDGVMREALRKVGNRLKDRAAAKDARTAASVRDVPAESVAATLGPTTAAALEDPMEIIEAVVDSARERFLRWTERAQHQALGLVPHLEDGPRQILEAEQARDRTEAWAWLRQAFIDVVNLRVYDPHPETPVDGEVNEDAVVPFGIVREAVARAGGAGRESVQASILARLPAILSVFGVATGPLLRRALGTVDVTTEGYEWEYGFFPRTRPFEPHAVLDGLQFVNFDDDALASDGWPGPFFMPGDHAGCMCDATPILIEGGRS